MSARGGIPGPAGLLVLALVSAPIVAAAAVQLQGTGLVSAGSAGSSQGTRAIRGVVGQFAAGVSVNGGTVLGSGIHFGGTPEPVAAPEPGGSAVALRLLPGAPNPFRHAAVIRFELAAPQQARVDVFGIDGARVTRLLDGALPAGAHAVSWNGRDDHGRQVAAGVYLYRIRAGGSVAAGRLVRVR